jgi:hypothetical protein
VESFLLPDGSNCQDEREKKLKRKVENLEPTRGKVCADSSGKGHRHRFVLLPL